MADSTENSSTGKPAKPEKPSADFPLFPHATGRWAKKIRGKLHYFGPWRDPYGALTKYIAEREDLHAGRKPRVSSDSGALELWALCDQFVTSKQLLLDSGEITQRTFDDYFGTCARLQKIISGRRLVTDLRPDDFDKLRSELAKALGPVSLGNEIQRMRMVFKFAVDTAKIPKPVEYGQNFKRPTKRALRRARNERGTKMLTPAQLRRLIAAAGVQVRAMILLGLNGGFGNNDCGMLPLSAVHLGRKWIDFPRPKTEVARKVPLWPETIAALKVVIDSRPDPKDDADAGLVFITKYGQCWSKETTTNPISAEFRKLLIAEKLYRKGIGFYMLRHIFQTIGAESRDHPAVQAIMGHADSSMSGLYTEEVSDKRLRDVVNHVRKWLFKK